MVSISSVANDIISTAAKVGICMLSPAKSIYFGRHYFQDGGSKLAMAGVCLANVVAIDFLKGIVDSYTKDKSKADMAVNEHHSAQYNEANASHSEEEQQAKDEKGYAEENSDALFSNVTHFHE